MFVVILFMVLATALLSWSWVKGIDYMKENHPDYKGEDFLNWGNDDDVTKTAGRDAWDCYNDDTIHTEQEF
jgi:hypothetical protein